MYKLQIAHFLKKNPQKNIENRRLLGKISEQKN